MNNNNNNDPLMGVPYMISGVYGVLPGAARNGHHWNDDFQRLVNQHGWNSFVYLTFEPVSFEKLGEAEQKLYDDAVNAGLPVLNKRRPSDNAHSIGYTLSEETKRLQSHAKKGKRYAAKRWALLSPDGALHETIGLKEFCRKHGLEASCVSRVARGLRPVHKGWRKAAGDPKR